VAFVRNAWYVASWASELERSLKRQTILGEDVVLFRTQDGIPVALRDRCPHRLLPLSRGALIGDTVRCGYHGLVFDSAGTCVHVPGQDVIPPNARVKTYPLAERLGLIWIWMGDPDKADETEIYDLAEYHQPGWGVAYGDALHVKADYLLLCDNLCDPSHVEYVHPTTLGSPGSEGGAVTFEGRDWGVATNRWSLESEPIGFAKAFGNFADRVDRWQYYYMYMPSIAIIDFGTAPAGTGAPEGNLENAIRVFSCHFLTPETETSCHDYWLHVRNFGADDPAIGEGISEQFRIAFAEDKVVLEDIQREEDRFEGGIRVGLDLDASAALFRRKIDQTIKAEA